MGKDSRYHLDVKHPEKLLHKFEVQRKMKDKKIEETKKLRYCVVCHLPLIAHVGLKCVNHGVIGSASTKSSRRVLSSPMCKSQSRWLSLLAQSSSKALESAFFICFFFLSCVKSPHLCCIYRHLERQELAKKQVEEQREREEKVFMVNAAGNQNLFTYPQPFNLHRGYHAEERSRKTREQIRQHEQEV